MLIEATEESGSPDLPYYVNALAARLGSPSLVVCLDSGCGNYEQLWCTTSLRGIITGTLTVRVLHEGVHSGDAGGIVPSSFRIARQLLDRLFGGEQASSRVIAVMHLHDGFTLEQVASQTGMSVSGVRKRLRTIGARLTQLVEGQA